MPPSTNITYTITFMTDKAKAASKELAGVLGDLSKITASNAASLFQSSLGPFGNPNRYMEMARQVAGNIGRTNAELEGGIWRSAAGGGFLGGVVRGAQGINAKAGAVANATTATLDTAQAYGAHGAKLPREAIEAMFDANLASDLAGKRARMNAEDVVLQRMKSANNYKYKAISDSLDMFGLGLGSLPNLVNGMLKIGLSQYR